MFKFINAAGFARHLFDQDELAVKAGCIMQAILEARSPRLSHISHRMPGSPDANYKLIQRFLDQADPKAALLRLFQADAPFVIGDPTEIRRPQAKKTPYVGTLSDGQTRGFWLLLLSTPFRGRALPCSFVTYSSRTIAEEANSRNLEHFEAFDSIKELLGDKPLVLDREFSIGLLLENLAAEGVNFVIRLHLGSHPPIFVDATGRRVDLTIARKQSVVYRQLYYQGKVAVNVIGVWQPGFGKPLWVMTSLEPEEGLKIYQARVKIEESFKDLKDLLRLEKIMNKTQPNVEKMIAMMLITYGMGLLVGEAIRDEMYNPAKGKRSGKQWYQYSGLHILLTQKITLTAAHLRRVIRKVQQSFARLVLGEPQHVRTPV